MAKKVQQFQTANEESLWQDIVREVAASGNFDWETAVDHADAIISAFRRRIPDVYEE